MTRKQWANPTAEAKVPGQRWGCPNEKVRKARRDGQEQGLAGTRHLLHAYCVPSRVFSTSAPFCHQNRERSGLPLLVLHELRLQL